MEQVHTADSFQPAPSTSAQKKEAHLIVEAGVAKLVYHPDDEADVRWMIDYFSALTAAPVFTDHLAR